MSPSGTMDAGLRGIVVSEAYDKVVPLLGGDSEMRKVVILIFALMLFVGAPSDAKSVHKEFSEAWAERDNAYADDFARLLQQANDAVEAYRATVAAGEPRVVQIAAFKAAMDKAHAASAARGRGLLLIEFREFMIGKPSAARTELWIQEKAAELQREEAAVEAQRQSIETFPTETPDQVIVASTQSWFQAHGTLQGRVGEILLIDANLRSYFTARGEEKARSRGALAAILGGLAAGVQQQQDGFAPAPPLPITTRCNTYFSGTVCTTN